ncbi:prephenate dehydrogenase [Streptomyces sp. MB09-01]|uniref:prephenate dehydrogenase n=1 Tax=Streptomyces sp. MB09-01 TaxID=3028666 RepID=UPI0029B5C573|nr:prephenate dehydrogenase [Streptomyces sp. MB09-01]MDX3537510.1 prephenate dehydrogenase [Streptomyces sp. MB09-01]
MSSVIPVTVPVPVSGLRPPPTGSAARGLRTCTVVGTGLIGTSVALALTSRGVRVHLSDHDRGHALAAQEMGAGTVEAPSGQVDLAVIAVPPERVASTLYSCQQQQLARAYTDVASVKAGPWRDVLGRGCDSTSYIGSHPMAGRERSGPRAGQADLFAGRPWVLTPSAGSRPDAVALVRELVDLCGATAVVMTPEAHDRAVALVSHAPHVVAALMAGRLEHAEAGDLRLTGQGLRDVTRIAAGQPGLWVEILAANAGAVADVLEGFAADLEEMITSLRMAAGARGPQACTGKEGVVELLRHGQTGHGRIPGKHGGPHAVYETVMVHVGDRPGELARLLTCASGAGVNIEDMAIDHTSGSAGVVELMVAQGAGDRLATVLGRYEWRCERSAPS